MYNSILTLKELGKSQRQIADVLQLSKSTVNKYCQMSEADGKMHSCRRAGRSAFSVAEAYIRDRLLLKPKLRSSRLYWEVMERYPGIEAKQRAFRSYVKNLRDELPRTQQRFFSVIETLPGRQIQVDGGEMRVDCVSGGQIKVYFCSFVLSFSRQLFVHCQTRPYNTDDFIAAHCQSFRYFEGMAAEYVYDQTKLVAIHEKYREVLYNEAFHQFSVKSGFHPLVCEGYDPQSKGKIERCIQEVKQGFLYGRSFADLADLRDQLQEWLFRFNRRIHSTTGRVPQDLWAEEKSLLVPPPEVYIQPQTRKADKTGLISYSGNKYSVPLAFQNRIVLIEPENGMLAILDPSSGKVMATHQIPAGKGNLIKNNNHYRDFQVILQELKDKTISRFSRFADGVQIVERLLTDNPKIARDQLRAMHKLLDKYDHQTWDKAYPLIMEMPTLRATLIESILAKAERLIRLDDALSQPTVVPVKESAIQRSLSDYMGVIRNDRNH